MTGVEAPPRPPSAGSEEESEGGNGPDAPKEEGIISEEGTPAAEAVEKPNQSDLKWAVTVERERDSNARELEQRRSFLESALTDTGDMKAMLVGRMRESLASRDASKPSLVEKRFGSESDRTKAMAFLDTFAARKNMSLENLFADPAVRRHPDMLRDVKILSAALLDRYVQQGEGKKWADRSASEKSMIRLGEMIGLEVERRQVEQALASGALTQEKAKRYYMVFREFAKNGDLPRGKLDFSNRFRSTANVLAERFPAIVTLAERPFRTPLTRPESRKVRQVAERKPGAPRGREKIEKVAEEVLGIEEQRPVERKASGSQKQEVFDWYKEETPEQAAPLPPERVRPQAMRVEELTDPQLAERIQSIRQERYRRYETLRESDPRLAENVVGAVDAIDQGMSLSDEFRQYARRVVGESLSRLGLDDAAHRRYVDLLEQQIGYRRYVEKDMPGFSLRFNNFFRRIEGAFARIKVFGLWGFWRGNAREMHDVRRGTVEAMRTAAERLLQNQKASNEQKMAAHVLQYIADEHELVNLYEERRYRRDHQPATGRWGRTAGTKIGEWFGFHRRRERRAQRAQEAEQVQLQAQAEQRRQRTRELREQVRQRRDAREQRAQERERIDIQRREADARLREADARMAEAEARRMEAEATLLRAQRERRRRRRPPTGATPPASGGAAA